jgi:hypothetical protein
MDPRRDYEEPDQRPPLLPETLVPLLATVGTLAVLAGGFFLFLWWSY